MDTKGLTNKEIQRLRMTKLFIDSAVEIIEEEGLDALTIRNVADRAAFNSATLYNYFDNLDRLRFYAVLKYMDSYLIELAELDLSGLNPLEAYKKIWMVFAKNAFKYPRYYLIIFFMQTSHIRNEMLDFYYNIYPDLREKRTDYEKMLSSANLYKRSAALMEDVIKEGLIEKNQAMIIDEIIVKVFHSLLRDINDNEFDEDTALKVFERHMTYLLNTGTKKASL